MHMLDFCVCVCVFVFVLSFVPHAHPCADVYGRTGETFTRCLVTTYSSSGAAATAPVLLRTLALLAEADGDHTGTITTTTPTSSSSSSSAGQNRQLHRLAESQHLFWRRLEQLMEEIELQDDGDGGSGGGGGRDQRSSPVVGVVSEAVAELSELLRVFRLLASHSLVEPENGAALEALVFPAALSTRR